MKIAIVGSRGFNDYEYFTQMMDTLIKPNDSFVSGGANGADSFAEQYAKEYGILINIFKPEWDKYGKKAGFIRNSTIWDHADFGVAFWDGVSEGTAHSFGIAKKQQKDLLIVDYVKRTLELMENKK